jgi:septal ring factor EnvC (AmiA/AmiB activator)
MNKIELEKAIEEMKAEIKTKEKELDNFELDNDDHEDQYRDMIEEFDGPVRIGSLEYSAARVLEEIDPTAYRCGLNDYVDSLEKEDDPKYKELEEELETLEDELSDLEADLEDLEA